MLGCRPPPCLPPPAALWPKGKSKKKLKKAKKVIDLLPEKAYLVSIERVIGTHYILGLREREVKGRKKLLTV